MSYDRFATRSASPRELTRQEVESAVRTFRRQANAAVLPGFTFKEGFVYNTVRAISARINQNYDAWPSEELKIAYKTFLGKPCFVNHRNDDWTKARGVVVAARYVEKGADKYIETIQETDARRFPLLGTEIRTGGMDSVSMGVEAGFTICSICENRATDVHDMCGHVKFHKGEYLRHPKTGKKTLVYENCHKLGFFELSYVFDPADETAVISRVIAAARTAKKKGKPVPHVIERYWLKRAFGEPTVPKQIDTLRDDDEESPEDPTNTFHNWITSPSELRDPDLDQVKNFDQHREDQGVDDDRRVEDVEDHGATTVNPNEGHYEDEEDPRPAMPINPPVPRKGRRTTTRGAAMSRRRYYAADDDGAPADDDQDGPPQDAPPQDPDALVAEAEQDLDDYDQESGGGDDGSYEDDYDDSDDGSGDDGSDDGDYDDDGSGQDYGDGAPPDFGGQDDGGQGGDDPAHSDADDDLPPWLQHQGNRRDRRQSARPVKKRSGRGNGRAPRGGEMPRQSLATRQHTAQTLGNRGRRHFQADESGHTDGGPYGVDDSQGAQEDVFISQVPAAEAVETADGEPISNNPGNLVARRRRAAEGAEEMPDPMAGASKYGQPVSGPAGTSSVFGDIADEHGLRPLGSKFDPNHYQRLADVIAALPVQERRAMALKMARQFKDDNPRFNELTFFRAAKCRLVRKGNRVFFAEDLVDPDKVDPSLSGTDAQDVKGDDFESLALDDVETQPKDASIHAFAAFDRWLASATGKTARQHGNANFIRRAAVSYAKATRNPQAALQGLFPTLDYILAHARRVEAGRTAAMNRYADESLDVAAPGGRIDVEAPTRNVTDADAQSSQFDLGDFGNNAGDDLADPDLDVVRGNAGTWAPDEGSKEASARLATAVEAMKCAEAHIAAMPNKYPKNSRWQLTAQFENMRASVVRDRTRLCEQMIDNNKIAAKKTARKVTAASSRGTTGLPPGLGSRSASLGSRQASSSAPNTDSAIFLGL